MARQLDLDALGEFGFIEAIRRRAGPASGAWAQGIGDDAARLRPRKGSELVVSTDALIEGVHFRWSTTDPVSLGHKTLAVSLSDLGAMGASPLGFLLSLAVPERSPASRVDGVCRGLLSEARAAGCPLVGGDTVRGPAWMLSVTVLGELPRGRALLRAGARPGDRLLVTGELGSAALGLHLLECGAADARGARPFVRRHLRPRPPFRAGVKLRKAGLATAAVDLSDGLTADLSHVLKASAVAAEVCVDRLPLGRGMRALCDQSGLDPVQLALTGGEDYELLFTVRKTAPTAAQIARRLGCRVAELGVVRRGRGLQLLRDGSPVTLPAPGFEHFKPLPAGADK